MVSGGLISYGPSFDAEMAKQEGVYLGCILEGAKPAELPIQQPTKIDLVINLKAAKALGLSVKATLLATADDVIEAKRRQFIALLNGATLAWPLRRERSNLSGPG